MLLFEVCVSYVFSKIHLKSTKHLHYILFLFLIVTICPSYGVQAPTPQGKDTMSYDKTF